MTHEKEIKTAFQSALSRIKALRDPHAESQETNDLMWNDVEQQVVFDFVERDLEWFYFVSRETEKISVSCLCFIIRNLLKEYNHSFQVITVENAEGIAKAHQYLLDTKTETLFLFKELEKCPFWKIADSEPDNVKRIMEDCGAKRCAYIYLVYDYAYLQVIGHNEDINDPGRGYNIYSIKWFFEQYFGPEEYSCFESALISFVDTVHDYLGYSVIRNLTVNSRINFKKLVDNEVMEHPYNDIMRKTIQNRVLDSNDYSIIRDNYLTNSNYIGLLGGNDYAESFITSEWLFDSMQKAKAIDLTVIGMGYFKAIEQLLYDVICLHKNEGRLIKSDYSRTDLPNEIELNDDNIRDNAIDTTIGSMAVFIRDNLDIFNLNITYKARKYIREAVFSYKDLRNGYFHKDNIHDWEIIENIRVTTYQMMFLILGALALSNDEKTKLGFPQIITTDYYRLCEYVNFHHKEPFYLDYGNAEEIIVIAHFDPQMKVSNMNSIEYSGVYFCDVNNKPICFRPEDLPNSIALGRLDLDKSSQIGVSFTKVKTIFENGKFIGPSIAAEERLKY